MLLLNCFDYWLERYQTLLVGVGAVIVAFQQAKLMRGQQKIMQDQIKQSKDLAMLKADKALSSINQMVGDFIGCGNHQETGTRHLRFNYFWWDPAHLKVVKIPDGNWNDEDVVVSVASAFPLYTEDVRAMLQSFKKLVAVRDEAETSPFPNITLDWSEWPDPETHERKGVFDAALNDLFARSNRVSPLYFRNRTLRDPNERFVPPPER
jgi:hypothetical protein